MSAQVLEERVDSSLDAAAQYLWGLRFVDDIILRDRDTKGNGALDERRYAMHDLRFSIVAIANSSGTILERYAYDAHGRRTVLTNSLVRRAASNYEWEFGYTGRRLDHATKLYFFRSRYYSAELGRFVGRDPLAFVDGTSLYRAYFVPGGIDPSGTLRAIEKDRQTFGCINPRNWYVKIEWQLGAGELNGFIVQKICRRTVIVDCRGRWVCKTNGTNCGFDDLEYDPFDASNIPTDRGPRDWSDDLASNTADNCYYEMWHVINGKIFVGKPGKQFESATDTIGIDWGGKDYKMFDSVNAKAVFVADAGLVNNAPLGGWNDSTIGGGGCGDAAGDLPWQPAKPGLDSFFKGKSVVRRNYNYLACCCKKRICPNNGCSFDLLMGN